MCVHSVYREKSGKIEKKMLMFIIIRIKWHFRLIHQAVLGNEYNNTHANGKMNQIKWIDVPCKLGVCLCGMNHLMVE